MTIRSVIEPDKMPDYREYEGVPVAEAYFLVPNSTYLNEELVYVACPICWDIHVHGWKSGETGYSHRWEHCSSNAEKHIDGDRGYYIYVDEGLRHRSDKPKTLRELKNWIS